MPFGMDEPSSFPIEPRQEEGAELFEPPLSRDQPVLAEPVRDLVEAETVALYKEYGGGLLRYAYTLTAGIDEAPDAVQEAFLRYFILRSAGLRVENPRAWLYRVLRNYLLDRHKSFGVKHKVNLKEASNSPDWQQDPATQYQQREQARLILDRLSPRESACVRLRAEGFDYKEISGLLKIRPGTVGAMLARALKKIRNPKDPL